MAFDVTNTFVAGTDADASELNKNFIDIEAELNAFPTAGKIKNGSITNAMITDGSILTNKLNEVSTLTNLSTSTTILPTSGAIKSYIDSKEFTSFYSANYGNSALGLNNNWKTYNLQYNSSGSSGQISNGGYKAETSGNHNIGYYCYMHANPHGNVHAGLYIETDGWAESYSGGNSSLGQNVKLGGQVYKHLDKDQIVYPRVHATSGRGGNCTYFYLFVSRT
jgi:hypothetical protein